MDTAIAEGDFLKDSRGYPVKIEGLSEILQQVMIRLTAKQGSFIYDRKLGSKLNTLKASYISSGSLSEKALEMIREALSPIDQVEALSVDIKTTDLSERIELNVLLSINGYNTDLEVKI